MTILLHINILLREHLECWTYIWVYFQIVVFEKIWILLLKLCRHPYVQQPERYLKGLTWLNFLFGVLMGLHLCLEGGINARYCCAVLTSNDQLDALLACILFLSVGCCWCENFEAQWELCLFPHLPFHGASLRYFHLFWERRSIIRNATETTQAHTRPPIPLHLSHQIVQGRKNFCDKARPTPWGNHIDQLDGVIW